MHRFFIPRPYAENMMIRTALTHAIFYTVLKMKPGEKVQIVSDDGVTALAEIYRNRARADACKMP